MLSVLLKSWFLFVHSICLIYSIYRIWTHTKSLSNFWVLKRVNPRLSLERSLFLPFRIISETVDKNNSNHSLLQRIRSLLQGTRMIRRARIRLILSLVPTRFTFKTFQSNNSNSLRSIYLWPALRAVTCLSYSKTSNKRCRSSFQGQSNSILLSFAQLIAALPRPLHCVWIRSEHREISSQIAIFERLLHTLPCFRGM